MHPSFGVQRIFLLKITSALTLGFWSFKGLLDPGGILPQCSSILTQMSPGQEKAEAVDMTGYPRSLLSHLLVGLLLPC